MTIPMTIPEVILNQIRQNEDVNTVIEAPLQDVSQLPLTDTDRNSYRIVSVVAYLLGVPEQHFSSQDGRISQAIFSNLERSEPAKILRNLCILRTSMLQNFKTYNDNMRLEHRSLDCMLPQKSILYLSQQGITVTDRKKNLAEHIVLINGLIRDRINNCRPLFPAWINWNYLRDIFIMPAKNAATEKAEAEKYFQHRMSYPFQMYMNWTPSSEGNILANDYRFMTLLYQWNNDYLDHANLVSDIGSYTKEKIYDFVQTSGRTVIIVDCENSDPYKFLSALNSLNDLSASNITKIILYDDINAAAGWRLLKHHTDIPIEYHLIQRIKEEKSLADIKIATKISEEYYANHVDSFILASSDSDFWGVIQELPNARFLVLLEYLKDSNAIKEALDSRNFFHCYLDKFYSDNEALVNQTLLYSMNCYLREQPCRNLNDAIQQAEQKARIHLTAEERKALYQRLSKRLQLVVAENGDIQIEIRR